MRRPPQLENNSGRARRRPPAAPQVGIPRSGSRPKPQRPARKGLQAATASVPRTASKRALKTESRPAPKVPARPATGRSTQPANQPTAKASARPQPAPHEPSDTSTRNNGRRRQSAFRLDEAAVITSARQHARSKKWNGTVKFKSLPEIPVSLLYVMIAVALFLMVTIPTGVKWFNQQQEYRDLHAQLIDARADNEQLKQQLKRWKDPEYITVEARKRLGYVKPGDMEYVVADLPSKTPEKAPRTQQPPWFLVIADTVEAAGNNKDKTKQQTVINTERGVPAEGADQDDPQR